jgi:hypothetical protein
MEHVRQPTAKVKLWAVALRERGLADLAVPLLDVLQVWGFVGGQFLWMLAPFLGEEAVAPFAEALEQPETLRRLQQYLIEGEAAQ